MELGVTGEEQSRHNQQPIKICYGFPKDEGERKAYPVILVPLQYHSFGQNSFSEIYVSLQTNWLSPNSIPRGTYE